MLGCSSVVSLRSIDHHDVVDTRRDAAKPHTDAISGSREINGARERVGRERIDGSTRAIARVAQVVEHPGIEHL